MCIGHPLTLHRVPFLHTDDGGHEFNGGVTFPIEPDEPIPTTEEAEGWTLPVMWSVGLFAVACLVAVVFYGVQLQFPFE